MRSNLVVFLVAGLLIGALAGYLTRPESAEIRIGPLNIQVTGDRPARSDGPMTSSQMQHVALFTVIGGAIGLGLGFAISRRG
jgi:hypothetical protein